MGLYGTEEQVLLGRLSEMHFHHSTTTRTYRQSIIWKSTFLVLQVKTFGQRTVPAAVPIPRVIQVANDCKGRDHSCFGIFVVTE